MAEPQKQVIRSERARQLQQLSFSQSTTLTRDLPKDTVLKFLQLRLSGAIQETFGSGTPVADAYAAFDNLVPFVSIVVNGSRTIKNVKPAFQHIIQMMQSGMGYPAERASSAGAAAVAYPTANAGFTHGSTTQYVSVRESVWICFEHVLSRIGKESTWLNLKGVASAEVRLQTAAYDALLGFGNTTSITWGNSTLVIDIFTLEAQDVPAGVIFKDFRQTYREVTFSAQTTDYAIPINRGSKLSGLLLLGRDGAAGSSTTATGKLGKSNLLDAMKLVVNGQNIVKYQTGVQNNAELRARWGMHADYASNVSRLDGWLFLDLLSDDGRGDLETALDLRAPLVDSCDLVVSTNDATDISYANPISLGIETHEIVEYA